MNWRWWAAARRAAGPPLVWLRNRPKWLIGQSAEGWVAIGTFAQAGILAFAGWVAYDQWTSDKAMELQKKWTSPTMEGRRARVEDALICQLTDPPKAGARFAPVIHDLDHMTPDDRYNFLLRLIYPSDRYNGLIEDFSGFDEFYNSVNNCIDAGVCSKETSCLLFGQEARALAKYFNPYVVRQQTLFRDPLYGTDIGRMALECEAQINRNLSRASEERAGSEAVIEAFRPELLSELASPERTFIVSQRDAACRRMTPDEVRAQNEKAERVEATEREAGDE